MELSRGRPPRPFGPHSTKRSDLTRALRRIIYNRAPGQARVGPPQVGRPDPPHPEGPAQRPGHDSVWPAPRRGDLRRGPGRAGLRQLHPALPRPGPHLRRLLRPGGGLRAPTALPGAGEVAQAKPARASRPWRRARPPGRLARAKASARDDPGPARRARYARIQALRRGRVAQPTGRDREDAQARQGMALCRAGLRRVRGRDPKRSRNSPEGRGRRGRPDGRRRRGADQESGRPLAQNPGSPGHDEPDQDQQVGQQEEADDVPVHPVGYLQPARRPRPPLARPAAHPAPALRVSRVEPPAVRLAVHARRPPGKAELCDQGDNTSSGTFSAGVLRAHIHAAAEASRSASRVRNMNASGMRLAARVAPSWAAADPSPPAPPVSPKPPKSPPPNPPKAPKPNAAPAEPTWRSANPSPRMYSALCVGTPGPGDGCVIITCSPVAQIVTWLPSTVFVRATGQISMQVPPP